MSDSTRWLAIGGGGLLAGAVLGYVLGSSTGAAAGEARTAAPGGVATPVEARESARSDAPAEARLDGRIDELQRELREVRSAIERLIARGDTREPAALSDETLPGASTLPPALAAWMKRMEEQVALTGGAAPSEPLSLPGPGFAGQVPPRPPVDDSREAREAFDLSHFLWTYQQVLDVYGRPDQVHLEAGTIEWEYRYEDPTLLEEHDDVHFVFSGGLCVGMVLH